MSQAPSQTNDPQAAAKAKQKRQLLVLGGLSVVLLAVLFMQLGGDGSPRVATLAQASALTAPVEAGAEAGEEAELDDARDNEVLSEAPAEEALGANPFAAFWSTSVDRVDQSKLQAPTVALHATMPNGTTPVAIIDGQLRFVGDLIQGWTLDEVRSRSIVLRAPNNEWISIEMPLLYGRIDVPEALPVTRPEDPEAASASLGSTLTNTHGVVGGGRSRASSPADDSR